MKKIIYLAAMGLFCAGSYNVYAFGCRTEVCGTPGHLYCCSFGSQEIKVAEIKSLIMGETTASSDSDDSSISTQYDQGDCWPGWHRCVSRTGCCED